VLTAPDPATKVALSDAARAAWAADPEMSLGDTPPPDRPARPNRPPLGPPRDVPRRRGMTRDARVALLHAIAHIELNAIDLAWDLLARFGNVLTRPLLDDWVRVAADEARHFVLCELRLGELGAAYGDHAAHDGLWLAAERTLADPLARLAVVPMLFEARGLDTTPATVARLEKGGDPETAAILAEIAEEEISHVRAGVRGFEHLCRARRLDPPATFRRLVGETGFAAVLKPPFNAAARARAGMGREYYAGAH
jgi:uncharacterized ferritin-like protein (DUF455 family)